jgi:CubicO group peptidase (beta-lactamase class C family)
MCPEATNRAATGSLHCPEAVPILRLAAVLLLGLLLQLPWTAAIAAQDSPDELRNELALAEAWLSAQRAYDRVPAVSAALVHDQALLWSGAWGYADLESRRPAAADTIYGICSISKLFTGIAVMQQRDRGALSLDQPLQEILPWFRLQQAHESSPAVTLRNVLSHSAGLPRESDMPYWMGPDFSFPTREQVRELLAGQTTLYPADRYYQYSNLGLTLAGEAVAAVSGEDYEAYIRRHILEPLGLRDTDTGFPEDARAARVATGYAYPGRQEGYPPLPRYDTRGITPAAGFSSTALDLVRFASWQFQVLDGTSAEVLQPNSLREMQRVQWLDWDWSTARGLAFGVYRIGQRTLSGHAGSCPGFETRLFLDPVSHHAVAVLSNRNATDVDGYAVTLLDILEGGGTPPGQPADAPITDFSDFTGSYDMRPWDGEDLVFRWGEGLALVTLPTLYPLDDMVELQHIDGDRFHTVRSDGEPGHEVRFRRGDGGRVTHIEYHGIAAPRLQP